MSSLREVKDRISSVRSTLKITSAMKLVASSKLVKAQKAIEFLRPYENALSKMLSRIPGNFAPPVPAAGESSGKTMVLAFAGNTSMCGAFNANAAKKALEVIRSAPGPVEVWVFGRKMADALRKEGITAQKDFNGLVAVPSSEAAGYISAELRALYSEGKADRIVLVYNHFINTGRQVPVEEQFLPFIAPGGGDPVDDDPDYFILEPSAGQLAGSLVPQVLDLKLYAALLDSVASEHAARMVAMQAATDNAEDLLAALTLEYNKGRQQKITAEILDLVAGDT